MVYLLPHLFAFGGFLLVLSQFRMALSEVLKCCLLVPKRKKPLCFTKHVELSFKHELQALGHEFNVSESATYVK